MLLSPEEQVSSASPLLQVQDYEQSFHCPQVAQSHLHPFCYGLNVDSPLQAHVFRYLGALCWKAVETLCVDLEGYSLSLLPI